ncbi:hypothetical protein TSUD_118580 [Trifolium subterraneum]|uniref:Uncharacterized protein n=1 Tax=Trifolium subterraneum TaxID=3900 RepID=A0A2Z6M8R3_TRISU|nr:hypothetical protein TSUD_118580 [Trifolium subterraneum]
MKKTFSTNSATRRDSYYPRQPPSPIFHHRSAGFHPNNRHLPTHPRLPTFTINLRFNHRTHRRDLRRDDLESLIKKCKPNPDNFTFNTNESIAVSLNFNQKTDAINAVIWFWQSRLSVNSNRIHDFTPEFITNSDNVELDVRLRNLFVSHVKELMNGKEVNRWIEEWDRLLKEINHVNSLLSKSYQIRVQEENIDRKKVLDGEKNLIERRLKEFESAMECILKYLEENGNVVDLKKVCLFMLIGGKFFSKYIINSRVVQYKLEEVL